MKLRRQAQYAYSRLLVYGSRLWVLLAVSALSALEIPQGPNIVLVLTDDQGFGQLGCQGHPWLETPHLDTLRAEGTAFTDFHVSPTCSPTRAALLTGNVPFKNGVSHTVGARSRLALSAVTLPQMLKRLGYTTGIFGKWHLGLEEQYQPGARGFDEVFVHGYGGIGQGKDVPENQYQDPILRHNGRFVKTRGFCTDVFFSQALGWIQSNKDRPFFAYISTNAPHGPFIAPPLEKEKFRRYGFQPNQQGFYGMIENIDTNVGRLMACLKAWNLDNNTLIIFMSDNGYVSTGMGTGVLGERNSKPLSAWKAGLRGSKRSPHEGGTRVPAIFRWKGVLKAGGVSTALAAHIDILPTLLELAGGVAPPGIDGKSLVPLLKEPASSWPDRSLFFHIGRWSNKVGPDASKYDASPRAGFAVRNARYRLVNNTALYDILEDPGETQNLSAQKPEVVQSMQAAYDRWWDSVRPYLVNEGIQKLGANPYHLDYQRQKEQGRLAVWSPPVLRMKPIEALD